MMHDRFVIGQTRCEAFQHADPRYVLIQPIDTRDAEDRTAALLAGRTDVPFLHVAFAVSD